MAYGDFKEVKHVASGEEGEGISINDNEKKFTPEMARKWLDRHDKGEIKLNSIELKKARERANA
jgi:hypothetical protein